MTHKDKLRHRELHGLIAQNIADGRMGHGESDALVAEIQAIEARDRQAKQAQANRAKDRLLAKLPTSAAHLTPAERAWLRGLERLGVIRVTAELLDGFNVWERVN